MSSTEQKGKLALVIGGGGFLGRHIVEELLNRGWRVNVFDVRKTYEDERVNFFTGDLRVKQDLTPALINVFVVFHCASPSPLSNNRSLFIDVNVHGTKNIIECCKSVGIRRLVLTSSASVVYEGYDMQDVNEDTPYAGKPIDAYTETKIDQEKVVLEANMDTGVEETSFFTIAIRPHGIYGPRDPHVVPTLTDMAKLGKTKYIIGDGENIVDFTHVKNVVHGHILAAEHLFTGSKACGNPYHITNDEPVKFWTFMTKILVGLDYPAPSVHLPYWLLYIVASILAVVSYLLSPFVNFQPTFTPMKVALAGTHHYYSCSRAKRDLHYTPIINMEDGIKDTIQFFSYLRNPKVTGKKEQ